MPDNTTNPIYSPIPRLCPEDSGKIDGFSPSPVSRGFIPGSREDNKDVPQKAVICFQCGLISLVPQGAFSTKCRHCSAYINLDNVILHKKSHKTLIQTRGDVTVKSGTDFKGINIHSHNLTLGGKISGNFECSGTCLIKENQHITGTVRVHSLVIEKNVSATFAKTVETANASISGTFNGFLEASGTVTIHKTGKILGDVKAPKLIIENGGTHFGHYLKYSPE